MGFIMDVFATKTQVRQSFFLGGRYMLRNLKHKVQHSTFKIPTSIILILYNLRSSNEFENLIQIWSQDNLGAAVF